MAHSQSNKRVPRKGWPSEKCKTENATTQFQRPITKIALIYPADGYEDRGFKAEDAALIGAESVKADNELLKEFMFSCHKQETATAHALFKVN